MNSINLQEVARYQRILIISLLLNLMHLVPHIGLYLILALFPFQIWAMWKFGKALNVKFTLLWITGWCVLSVVFPIGAAILLVALNQKAVRLFKQAGVRVGLLGVSEKDVPLLPVSQPAS